MWLSTIACRPHPFDAEPLPPDPPEARCPVAPAVRVDAPRRVDVRVVLGDGVSFAAVRGFTQTAAAFWRRTGLELVSVGVEPGGPAEVLGGDVVALDRDTVGLSANDAEARVLEATIAPLRAWLGGRTATDAIELVFVPQVASRTSPIQRVVRDLAGLTVGPGLRGDASLAPALSALGPDHPVTSFVGMDALAELAPERARWVVAHEIGHALGLAHDEDPANLMAPEPGPCTPTLRRDQLLDLR